MRMTDDRRGCKEPVMKHQWTEREKQTGWACRNQETPNSGQDIWEWWGTKEDRRKPRTCGDSESGGGTHASMITSWEEREFRYHRRKCGNDCIGREKPRMGENLTKRNETGSVEDGWFQAYQEGMKGDRILKRKEVRDLSKRSGLFPFGPGTLSWEVGRKGKGEPNEVKSLKRTEPNLERKEPSSARTDVARKPANT